VSYVKIRLPIVLSAIQAPIALYVSPMQFLLLMDPASFAAHYLQIASGALTTEPAKSASLRKN
jgi:hypothetical protein